MALLFQEWPQGAAKHPGQQLLPERTFYLQLAYLSTFLSGAYIELGPLLESLSQHLPDEGLSGNLQGYHVAGTFQHGFRGRELAAGKMEVLQDEDTFAYRFLLSPASYCIWAEKPLRAGLLERCLRASPSLAGRSGRQ